MHFYLPLASDPAAWYGQLQVLMTSIHPSVRLSVVNFLCINSWSIWYYLNGIYSFPDENEQPDFAKKGGVFHDKAVTYSKGYPEAAATLILKKINKKLQQEVYLSLNLSIYLSIVALSICLFNHPPI